MPNARSRYSRCFGEDFVEFGEQAEALVEQRQRVAFHRIRPRAALAVDVEDGVSRMQETGRKAPTEFRLKST